MGERRSVRVALAEYITGEPYPRILGQTEDADVVALVRDRLAAERRAELAALRRVRGTRREPVP